jgi:hypothetical protein
MNVAASDLTQHRPPVVPPQRKPKTSPLRSRNQYPSKCGAAEQPDTAARLRARLLKINITYFGLTIVPLVTPKRTAAMSALGHKRSLTRLRGMSALPPKADIPEHDQHVR